MTAIHTAAEALHEEVPDDPTIGWLHERSAEWSAGEFAYDPDDPESIAADNLRRAGFAAGAVERYAAATFFGLERCTGEPVTQVLGDLLGDIMHLCDAIGRDFAAMCDGARFHYVPELVGEL